MCEAGPLDPLPPPIHRITHTAQHMSAPLGVDLLVQLANIVNIWYHEPLLGSVH